MAAQVPWYKEKLSRKQYLRHGEPVVITSENLAGLPGWREIEEMKKDMWMDSRAVVAQKNKKREYVVGPLQDPTKIEPKKRNGKYWMEIEILNLDRRGFRYSDEGDDPDSLNREFWPVVEQLLAVYFAPKLRRPVLPQVDELLRSEDK